MPSYAVIEDGGKQYRVEEGMVLELERKPLPAGSRFEFERVLLVSDGERVHVGRPLVEGARVVAQVVDQVRGPKQVVFTYKRRKNERRRLGHRQPYTRVRISEVTAPAGT